MGERVRIAVHDTVGPLAVLTTAASSGIQHWRDVPFEWGQGWGAYGRRFGYAKAADAAENAIKFAGGAALREDPRYTPAGGGHGFWARVRHIVSGTFWAPVRGGTRLAYSRLIGDYGAGFLANAWYPPSVNSPTDGLLRGTYSLGGDLASNALLEFWPDIKRKVFNKH